MNKYIKKNIIRIMFILILMLLFLFIFKNRNSYAAWWEKYVTTIGTMKFYYTANFSKYVSDNSNWLLNLTDTDIKNAIGKTLAPGNLKDPDNPDGEDLGDKTSAIYHRAGICLYHQTSDVSENINEINGHLRICNVIDINMDGINQVKIYGTYGRDNGNGKYTISNRTDAEIINLDSYTASNALAHAIYCSIIGNYNGITDKEVQGSQHTSSKSAIKWIWHKKIKDKIKDDIDPTFYSGDMNGGETTDDLISLALRAEADNTDLAYKKLTKKSNDTLASITVSGNNTYIGPLKVEYSGTDITLKVTVDEKIYTGCSWAIKQDGAFIEQTGNVVSGGDFYVIVNNKIENASSVNVEVTASKEYYKARMMLFCSDIQGAQQIAIFEGKKDILSESISFLIEKKGTIIIQKVNSRGENLKLEEIEFRIFKQDGDKWIEFGPPLITNEQGNTEKVKLTLEQGTYKIKETKNPHYGYKHNEGKSEIVTIEGGKDKVVEFENTSELTELNIEKIPKLEGVEFKIYRQYIDNLRKNNYKVFTSFKYRKSKTYYGRN